MNSVSWLGFGAVLLACGWIGCSGTEESQTPASGASAGQAGSAGTSATGGSGGASGGGGSATGGGGSATGGAAGAGGCAPTCPPPPAGCHYEGAGSCNPPTCPTLVCEEAGVPDASPDATCLIDCGAPPPGCHFVGEPTCNPPKCPPMECVDAGPDATSDAHNDGPSPDGGYFPAALDGIWLIGWSGGMNHFSWVKLSGASGWGGEAQFLAGDDLFANVPFWNCSGSGTWMVTAKPDTIGLYFPSGCIDGFASFTFVSFDLPSSPPKAELHATMEDLANPGQPIDGFRFPSDQCDAAMSACTDPWQ